MKEYREAVKKAENIGRQYGIFSPEYKNAMKEINRTYKEMLDRKKKG